jgi:hypothetical protein
MLSAPSHGLVDAAHVDRLHPDSDIAITSA